MSESTDNFVHIRQLLDVSVDESAAVVEHHEHPDLQTGYHDLDVLFGGLRSGDLVVVGALPSVGKSSFALGIARNAAVNQRANVGFYSLEMSSEQLAIRLLSAESGVDSNRLRLGQNTEMEERRIIAAAGRLSDANIWFDVSPVLTAAELRSKSRRLATEVSPGQGLIVFVSTTSLVFLVLLGVLAAQVGGANIWKGALRVGFWGALAMAITAGIGTLFGAVV